jgi:hypothetical protein
MEQIYSITSIDSQTGDIIHRSMTETEIEQFTRNISTSSITETKQENLSVEEKLKSIGLSVEDLKSILQS